MQLFFLLSALIAQAFWGVSASNNAFNHVTMQYVPEGVRWIEVGFFTITAADWTTVTATYRNFKDPVVFLSSPQLDGETSDEGAAMSLRIKDVTLTRFDAFTSVLRFKAKSYNVNSSYCSTRYFYTPEDLDIPDSNIGWLAVEKGKYNVSNKAFIISTDNINRTTPLSRDKANLHKSIAPLGICDYGQNCRIEGDNTTLLVIAQIQTLRFDRFLLMRGVDRGPDFVVMVLQTADSLDPAGYVIPSPGEDYAWMLFERGMDTNCIENLVIESFMYQVTYLKLSVTYINTFTQPPAIFGLLNSLIGQDSTGIRSFNLEVNSADFLTQEDKCRKEETSHVFEEVTAILVVGRAESSGNAVTCGATFNWAPPTTEYCVEVALHDTFGDGWGDNIALKIWSNDKRFNETYLYNDCSNSSFPQVVCYPSFLQIYFDIVTFEEPALEYWEIYWTVRTLGEKGFEYDLDGNPFIPEWYLGDFDTNMTVFNSNVDVYNPVDTQNQTCDRCKHPPKPKAKPKAAPGSSKSSEASSGSSQSEPASKKGPKSRDLHSTNSTISDPLSLNSTDSNGTYFSTGDQGKKKAKPSWPFPITLFDRNGDGWFNASEAWVMVPDYECNGTVTYHDNLRLPETITNPEYYIMNKERTEVLRQNTICGDLLRETCEERLPDGKYIFRVGGALSRDDSANTSSWEFCGARGRSMEELSFKIVKGKCFRGEKISARDICCADGNNAALFDGALVISNVAGDELTEFDTSLLEAALAESFSTVHGQLHSSVSLSSWEMQGSALIVNFRLSIDPTSLDVAVDNYEFFEAITPELLSSGQTYVQAGNFLLNVQSGLAELNIEDAGVLSAASGASMTSLEYLTISHKSAVESIYTVASAKLVQESSLAASPTVQSSQYKILSSFERSLVVVVACIAGIALVVKVVSVARRSDVSESDSSASGSPLMLDRSFEREMTDDISGTHGFAVSLASEMIPDFN